MIKQILGFLIGFLIFPCFAVSTEFEAAVRLAEQDAKTKKSESLNLAKRLDPKSIFDQYTTHPEQTKYYDGVMQTDTKDMNRDAVQSKSSESGTVISNTIREHPQFVISPSDPDMQHADLLQKEAYNILHGMTSQYVDCEAKEVCTIKYQEKTCEEAPQAIFQTCQKKLIIDIVSHETVTHYPLTAHLTVKDRDYAGVSMNPVTGAIGFLGPKHDAKFTLDGRLPANLDCQGLQGTMVSTNGNAKLDYIHFPSCANGMVLEIHMSDGHKRNITMDIAYKKMTYKITDRWVDDCGSMVNDATCKLQSKQCDIKESTQVIQGIPVTRACWQESFDYLCRGGGGEGTCQPLRTAHCEQVGSECKDKTSDQCTLYRQTYRCPIETCSPTSDVICGNGQEYCLDGNCTSKDYLPSNDFATAASALSAVADAGKQIDQSEMKVFTGHTAECSEKPIGYSNCCTETGWGQDIGLDNCPESAKKLHEERENKLAIKVGRYCSSSILDICVEHSQTFCVFSSRLAKILQEQGRKKQLKLTFGSAEHPNCSGISFEQLQAIDLSKIDFEEFFNEELSKNVKNKDPDVKQLQELIQQHVQQAMDSGKAHG